jgi:hypothetical protein
MTDHTVSKNLKFTLPQIQVTHPETKGVLMVASPTPGSLFDLKLPEGITNEELVIVVADLVEFHFKHCMGTQKALYDMGWSPEQVANLFFPGVPSNTELEEQAEAAAPRKLTVVDG